MDMPMVPRRQRQVSVLLTLTSKLARAHCHLVQHNILPSLKPVQNSEPYTVSPTSGHPPRAASSYDTLLSSCSLNNAFVPSIHHCCFNFHPDEYFLSTRPAVIAYFHCFLLRVSRSNLPATTYMTPTPDNSYFRTFPFRATQRKLDVHSFLKTTPHSKLRSSHKPDYNLESKHCMVGVITHLMHTVSVD